MSRAAKILAVDDHAPNLAILQEMLEGEYQLELASSGEEALERVGSVRPDILLLDIMMPGIDGYEVCRRIREELGLRSLKIIMVSAKASVQERLHAYEVGADDYVTKPFDEDELAAKIRVYSRLKAVEEINQLKHGVLSVVANQLRTPLCAIALPAQMLRDEPAMPRDQRIRLGRFIAYHGLRLERLFRKLDLLAEMRSGAWRPKLASVSAAEVVAKSLESCRAVAEEKRTELVTRCDGCGSMEIDAEVVRFGLESLLDAAVLIAEAGSRVVVESSQDGESSQFTIVIEKTASHPQSLQGLLEPLRELDPECDLDEGHALGVAIAHEIFVRHGGAVRIDAREGSCCVFELALPTRASWASASDEKEAESSAVS